MRHGGYLSLGPHGFHRVAYTEWGERDNPRVLVCVHGLTRNGRDFDVLAAALAGEYRVVCPDVVGRGASDWLAEKSDYGYPQYMNDMATLLAHLGAESVHWVGTSMGGLIGMMLAAQAASPVERLVMNDVGPFIPAPALERIAAYVGLDPKFAGIEELDAYLRDIYAPFGPFSDVHWQGLVRSSVRELDDGRVGLAYDPGIAEPIRAMPRADVDLWPIWSGVQCPVLVIRGERSDVLTAEVAEQMAASRARVRLEVLPGIGHAPTLMSEEQIALVAEWLSE
ncbi:MAG: alpha/beta fold hydrolase [Gammaproteobacteria bacterium]|nr:alpha/beta fold hydrolase [Gammaproteobacteria bacterium]NIM74519.1 alpha/beta fold hydrolase [Gammaproteobacteria bacterium]NIO26352.1 alpha/beta fold hydrolase [Gammaproteobacteria bacterium]NIO66904.1 alpha/beta fold hydrolase [Gammaproteobacteria bacterium]NIP45214.1 alpha/beta fold hydrolase [Gammaproteobacteria bacterium]